VGKSHCLSHSISLVPPRRAPFVFEFSDRGVTPGHRFPLAGAGTPPWQPFFNGRTAGLDAFPAWHAASGGERASPGGEGRQG
jgi:hypothetical protein